jgi:hypothetical protein
LFRIDPGWPFVISGLALIVSAVLIPAQRELHDLEQRLVVHQKYEERAEEEIKAYQMFLKDLANDATNERLLERLVRAQLNKMPKDERPLLLMPTANETVPTWIESSVTVEIPKPTPYADTLFSRIASGPRRLWVLATGAFLVFLGVMFAPTTFASRRREEPDPALDGAQPEWQDSAGGVATLEHENIEQEDVECEATETDQTDGVAAEDAAEAVDAEDVRAESIEEHVEGCAEDPAHAVVSISASSVMIEAETALVEEASAEEVAAEEVAEAISAESGESMAADANAGVAVDDIIEEIDETAAVDSSVNGQEIEESVEGACPESCESAADDDESAEESDEECDESGDMLEDAAGEIPSEIDAAIDGATEESPAEQIAATALAEPEPEPVSAIENEPQVCVIETYPSDFGATHAGDAETLDSALGAFETHEAPDVHELQYDASDLDSIDEPVSDDTDPGESIESAETTELPAEPDPIEERSSIPEATDRALDSTSLFAGLDETRWIDTRSGSSRGR